MRNILKKKIYEEKKVFFPSKFLYFQYMWYQNFSNYQLTNILKTSVNKNSKLIMIHLRWLYTLIMLIFYLSLAHTQKLSLLNWGLSICFILQHKSIRINCIKKKKKSFSHVKKLLDVFIYFNIPFYNPVTSNIIFFHRTH